MERTFDRKLILEDGQVYQGHAFGAPGDRVLEIVFNTSMAGYQEILSDPSYTGQAVVLTYPLIGSYGMAEEDYETDVPTIGALIVRAYNDEPSNFRSRESLDSVMKRFGIAGICGVDTRKLNRSIRDHGSRKALITDAGTALEEGLRILHAANLPTDAVSRVSCREIRNYPALPESAAYTGSGNAALHIVLVDCGMKKNILRSLQARGCAVTVVPWNTSAEQILALAPDGIMLSNGPGDPTDVRETIASVRGLLGRRPIFGICLGHQILALACGARTYKLKFGHRGGNHPVRDLATGRIEITSQNHSYAVDAGSLAKTPLTATHINLLDGTIEGVKCEQYGAFSVQYHPESCPGPQDSSYLFDRFLDLVREKKDGGDHA